MADVYEKIERNVKEKKFRVINKEDLVPIADIDSGAFGCVCKALDKQRQADVAVKVLNIREQLTEGEVNTFIKEVEIMYTIRDENVLDIYGVCIEQDKLQPYCAIVLPYMENGSIRGLFQDIADLQDVCEIHVPWSLRTRMLYQVASGMLFLHNNNILHLDLKASNILLNEDLKVKIADFGLSRVFTSSVLSKTNTKLGGTPTHMPPEYLTNVNKKPAQPFDVYSYAICMWEVLTGKKAYEQCHNQVQLLCGVQNGCRPDDKELPMDIPNEHRYIKDVVIPLMKQCWNEDPDQRKTMTEIKSTLSPYYEAHKRKAQEDVSILLNQLHDEKCRNKETHLLCKNTTDLRNKTLDDYVREKLYSNRAQNSVNPHPLAKNIVQGQLNHLNSPLPEQPQQFQQQAAFREHDVPVHPPNHPVGLQNYYAPIHHNNQLQHVPVNQNGPFNVPQVQPSYAFGVMGAGNQAQGQPGQGGRGQPGQGGRGQPGQGQPGEGQPGQGQQVQGQPGPGLLDPSFECNSSPRNAQQRAQQGGPGSADRHVHGQPASAAEDMETDANSFATERPHGSVMSDLSLSNAGATGHPDSSKYAQGTSITNTYNISGGGSLHIGNVYQGIARQQKLPQAKPEPSVKIIENPDLEVNKVDLTDPDAEVSTDDLHRIARDLGVERWRMIGRHCLLFSDGELDAISSDYSIEGLIETIYQMFRQWKEKHGHKATRKWLATSLVFVDKKELIDKILNT